MVTKSGHRDHCGATGGMALAYDGCSGGASTTLNKRSPSALLYCPCSWLFGLRLLGDDTAGSGSALHEKDRALENFRHEFA